MFRFQRPVFLRRFRLTAFPTGAAAHIGSGFQRPGPLGLDRFQRGDPLSGGRFELLPERFPVVGDEFGAVACAADLDIEHLLGGEIGMLRLHGGITVPTVRPWKECTVEAQTRSIWRSCGSPG